jgi:hypothetical protein
VAALVLVLTTSDEQQIMTNQRIRTTAAAKEQPSKMTKATMSMTSQRIRVAVAVKEQL